MSKFPLGTNVDSRPTRPKALPVDRRDYFFVLVVVVVVAVAVVVGSNRGENRGQEGK